LLLRENGEVTLLKGKGMALGVLPQITIEPNEIELHPGDTLIFYTDGVTEAMNEDYDEFGMERLRLAVQSAAHLDAAAIRDAIMAAVQEHVGDTPQFDDLTLVVMKQKPS
jgi:sigma-B regulation protein RsbU (phosphoserine phosphatase)